MQEFSYDEHMAATAVAALASSKRKRDDQDVEMSDCNKMARTEEEEKPLKPVQKAPVIRVLKPAPFFYYQDHSREPDNDPLTPLTAPGRVPNFPAKMHAILSRTELRDVVAWLPHGRSWRVLKPREFEIKVLPKFFEHSKFSSFVRQANGWGFRRITQGPDRNSYYHEKFLRGLPHLSKDMKRPGVAEKKVADPAHEPNFYEISKIHPVPEKIEEDESILLQCTLQGGPKARVPIYTGAAMSLGLGMAMKPESVALPPRDRFVLDSFNQSLAASESQFLGRGSSVFASAARAPEPITGLPLQSFFGTPSSTQGSLLQRAAGSRASALSTLAAANQLSLRAPAPSPAFASPSMAAALNNSAAASQFAAGFAAATAFSQNQFRDILNNLSHSQPQHGSRGGFPPAGFR